MIIFQAPFEVCVELRCLVCFPAGKSFKLIDEAGVGGVLSRLLVGNYPHRINVTCLEGGCQRIVRLIQPISSIISTPWICFLS